MNNYNIKTIKKPQCDHILHPLEYIYGKLSIQRKGERPDLWTWDSISSNAHKCRVYSYWCQKCGKIILAPKPLITEE